MVQLLLQAARPIDEAHQRLLLLALKEPVEELGSICLPEGHALQRGGLVLVWDVEVSKPE